MTGTVELGHRVGALETAQNETTQTLRWTVAKLGRIAAVQDEHTLRLERIEKEIAQLRYEIKEVAQLRCDIKEVVQLRHELPVMIGDVMREVLKEQGK